MATPSFPSARSLARHLRASLEGSEAEPARGLLPAAVLLPLLDVQGSASLLFIRRSASLPDHADQVSFPGGVREPGDENLFATALRESVEEVGVDPEAVERIGALAPVSTLEKYSIQPFLTLWPAVAYRPASVEEVARVFTVPIAWLMAQGLDEEVVVSTVERRIRVRAWRHDGEVIWGATRRITLDLLARIRRASDGGNDALSP